MNLTDLVIPAWVKPVGVLIAIVVLASSMYGYGRLAQKSVDQLIFDKMALDAAKQKLESLAKEKEHDQNTFTVAENYTVDNARLQRNLEWLRQHPSTSPGLSGNANDASRLDAANGERERACEGSGFYSNALTCELKLKGFREWVILQRIPVE